MSRTCKFHGAESLSNSGWYWCRDDGTLCRQEDNSVHPRCFRPLPVEEPSDRDDGPGKVEWRLYCCSSTWGCPSFQGTRPCLRRNAQAVALRAASGMAEELGDRLLHACEEMADKAEEVKP